MKTLKYIIISLIATAFTYSLSAQTLNAAKEMYKQGKYSQTKEIFYKHLKASPNNAQLNQWYGVCLYFHQS